MPNHQWRKTSEPALGISHWSLVILWALGIGHWSFACMATLGTAPWQPGGFLFQLRGAPFRPTIWQVRKLVLGTGLSKLLNGTPVPGGPGESVSGSFAPTGPSPGLSTLLSGKRQALAQPETEAVPSGTGFDWLWKKWPVVRWILVSADLLLLSLSFLVVFKNSGPLTFLEWVLCCSSLMIGAALGSLALLARPDGREAKPPLVGISG